MADTTRTSGATALVFHSTTFNPVVREGQPWLTASEIAQALGYARTDAVGRIFERNAPEFTPSMTLTVNLTVRGSVADKPVRIFSLRGAHLVAMFARTERAAEFRRWVLDILDRETGQAAPALPEPRSDDAMREARLRLQRFYDAARGAAAPGSTLPSLDESGLADMAETLLHDALISARWLVHFDFGGQMRLVKVAPEAFVATLAEMARFIGDPGSPVSAADVFRIAVAAITRMDTEAEAGRRAAGERPGKPFRRGGATG